jgi:hypothetical protein
VKRLVLVPVALVAGTLASSPIAAQPPANRAESESRYRIAQMERVLEGAVEHGAAITRDRVKAVLPPGDTLMSGDNARARGFRLEGYGVFFDVLVPPFETETTLSWSIRTLDQNDLGLDSALKELRSFIQRSGDPNLQQALRRVELQVTPAGLGSPAVVLDAAGARNATGSASAATVDTTATSTPGAPAVPADPILNDPNEAYRGEVIQALKDAMLDHSAALGIAASEWLTIAAKGNDDRPRLAPADSDARTRIIRLRGSDLLQYLARQISREEALQRIEVRVF